MTLAYCSKVQRVTCTRLSERQRRREQPFCRLTAEEVQNVVAADRVAVDPVLHQDLQEARCIQGSSDSVTTLGPGYLECVGQGPNSRRIQ